ncbi:MAG: DUF917 domain-containing protein [Bacillota bacterium]
MRELTRQDICDILDGCAILGTGGGGKAEEGLQMIDRALAGGRKFYLAEIGELEADDLVISPYYCGSVSPDYSEKEGKGSYKIDGDTAVAAVLAAEQYARRPVRGLVATELGGANTAVAFYAAAMLDKIIIDGDPAGRAVPKLQHSTYFLKNIPMVPVAVANKQGDIAIFTQVKDDLSAEALIRKFAMESGNIIAVADHCVNAAAAGEGLIRGTISHAGRLGRFYREALARGENTAEKVAEAGRGKVIFIGVLSRQVWEEKNGFTCGDLYINGENEFACRQLHIWIQNENIMSWLDGRPYVTVPELISVFDARTGEIISNPYYSEGMALNVVGFPAFSLWESEAGLALFGPRSFGFDVDYEPKIKSRGCR